jgi:hypothetical protein
MAAKNKSIHCPVVIAVEGLDYFHLLLSQLDGRPEFGAVQLVDCFESTSDLRDSLEVLLKSSAFQRKEVRSLGVIRDAEHDGKATEESLRSSLQAVGMAVPPAPMVVARAVPHVGYLIIPHDKPSGCLEDACLEASTLAPEHVACTRSFLECVSQHIPQFNPNWQAKVKVHALIAGSGKNPAMTLGQSGKAGLWDFTRESLKVMLDFIRMLRDAE